MENIRKFNPAKKATVCFKNNCITVFDEAAEILEAVVISAGFFIAIALVAKAIK